MSAGHVLRGDVVGIGWREIRDRLSLEQVLVSN